MTEAKAPIARVSNKQILTALTDLPGQIAAAMAGVAPVQAVPAQDIPVLDDAITEPVSEETVKAKIDPGYLTHVTGTLQDRANLNRVDYVLYARKNKAGETKLAYCAADKWSALTDRRIIGPVSTISPK